MRLRRISGHQQEGCPQFARQRHRRRARKSAVLSNYTSCLSTASCSTPGLATDGSSSVLPTLSPRKATRSSARPPATGLPNGALLPLASLGDLGDLEVDLERLDDLPGRGRDPRCTDDRGDRGKDTADPSASMPTSPAAPRFIRYETGGASTATSAAMRTSMSVSRSRLDAAIEAAVIPARRSRTGVSSTGVSLVGAGMMLSCRWAVVLCTVRPIPPRGRRPHIPQIV